MRIERALHSYTDYENRVFHAKPKTTWEPDKICEVSVVSITFSIRERIRRMAPRIAVDRLDKAKDKLERKRDRGCPFCGLEEFHLLPNLLPTVFSISDIPSNSVVTVGANGTEVANAVYMDLALIVCDNCGHVNFFNAHQLGVFED